MKKILYFLLTGSLIIFTHCKDDDPQIVKSIFPKVFDDIPKTKYYPIEVFKDADSLIYGKWKFIRATGGIHGGGYQPDFDYLLVKPFGIFGIMRNDTLLSPGKLILYPKIGNNPQYIELETDVLIEKLGINLGFDNQRYIKFINDSLLLEAECCDRYSEIFARER